MRLEPCKLQSMNTIKSISLKKMLSKKRKQSLSLFSAIEHRLEFFSEAFDKVWINDSKSTGTGDTAFSLENIDGPIIWIVGQDQSIRDFDIIEELVLSKVSEIIYYGKHETRLKYLFGSKIKYSQLSTIDRAVSMAQSNKTKNIKVLFSPSCASFLTHETYQERGDYFKNLIENLI